MKKVKITLYLDVYHGMDFKWATANTNPLEKASYTKRYAIEVEIPDPNEPDEVIGGVVKEMV